MADDIQEELYLDNTSVIRVVLTRDVVNPATGDIETEPDTGRTDGRAWLSEGGDTVAGIVDDDGDPVVDPSPAPIHDDLVVTLVEAGSTGIYYGYLTGAVKNLRLASYDDGAVLQKHWEFGDDEHKSKSVILRKAKVA